LAGQAASSIDDNKKQEDREKKAAKIPCGFTPDPFVFGSLAGNSSSLFSLFNVVFPILTVWLNCERYPRGWGIREFFKNNPMQSKHLLMVRCALREA
jgi:hypothetical protein